MTAGRRSPAAFPRPVRPTNMAGDLIEGDCGTEMYSSISNRHGQHNDVEGCQRPREDQRSGTPIMKGRYVRNGRSESRWPPSVDRPRLPARGIYYEEYWLAVLANHYNVNAKRLIGIAGRQEDDDFAIDLVAFQIAFQSLFLNLNVLHGYGLGARHQWRHVTCAEASIASPSEIIGTLRRLVIVIDYSLSNYLKPDRHYLRPSVMPGQSSVRNGEAGRPAPLKSVASGLDCQA